MEKKNHSNKVGTVFCWIFGIILCIFALTSFVSASIFSGIISLIVALILLPPINKIIQEKTKIHIPAWVKIALTVVTFIIIIASTPNTSNNSNNTSNTQSNIQTNELPQSTLITTPVENMMPIREDIPTKFTMDTITEKNLTKIEGFETGRSLSITQIVGASGVITIDFNVYKFTSTDNSNTYYLNVTGNIKNEGGYEELNTKVSGSNCFSWKEDYGMMNGRFASIICQKENIIYEVYATTFQTLERPDNYMKDMITLFAKKIN